MSPSVGAAGSTNPLSRKLQKVLSLKLDQDPELLTALQGLSSVVSTNTLRARRNLRGDFERRGVELSVELCDTFVGVNDIVNNLCSEIDEMSKSCDVMFGQLTTARKQMSGLLEKTSALKKESSVVEMKSEVVKAFIARYQITPQQSAALRRSNSIDKEFFDALTRVKRIHDDCKVLVQNHQTAGLQIMESMALQQESGYECLYRWCQNECRHLNADAPEAGAILKQGFNLLKDRPVLFKTCLEELQKARRAAVVRMFINALTKGGPMGTPKPMELSSHDPIRYAGDMLAWLHQSIASEKDFLASILEDTETISLLLGHITEGLCRTLKVRVEQILSAEQDCLVLQKISNLSKFYLATMKGFLSPNSELIITIAELCKLCDRQFNSSLTLKISRLGDRGELPGLDLVPTAAFQEALHLLKTVLNNHDVSVVPDVNPVTEMIQLTDAVVNPIIAMCYTTGSELESVSGAVYVTNTLHYLRDLLSLYENTDRKLEELEKQMGEQLKLLTTTQTEYIIESVALSTAELVLSSPTLPSPLIAALTSEYLSDVSNRLDKALCQVESLTLKESKLLCSLKHRTVVWSKGCDDLLRRYQRLYTLVTDPQHGYPINILSKTPAQIGELMK